MIEVITDRWRLQPLKCEWDAIAESQNSPLLSFDWFATCAATIHADDEIRIVVVRSRECIQAIAPLCLIKENGAHTLELIGVSALYEPCGFLYRDQRSLMQLLHGLATLGLPLMLLRLPDDPVLHACLDKLSWNKAIILRRQTAPSAFLNLPSDWNTFLEKLSPNRRYDFRRKRKCMEKRGKVTTRILSPSSSELPLLLHDAMTVEDMGWKGTQVTSLLRNPKLRSFFENYLCMASENGSLRLCYIDIDDMPISMHIAIESHHAFWVMKLGYDESFAKCSPGTQLAMDTIEHSVRQGLARYEFLGSVEPWQQAWPIELRPYFTVMIYPYSPRGLLGLFRFSMTYSRKMVQRIISG